MRGHSQLAMQACAESRQTVLGCYFTQRRRKWQATTCGYSTGLPLAIPQASRMNWACDHPSGVAEADGDPGLRPPVPAGADVSHTCSGIRYVDVVAAAIAAS